ncbi:MAG: DUF3127 domain-containing protein [Bacteroidota bacterium]
MAYEVNGKIAAIYDTVQRTESFRTREFVIEKSDDIGGRVITNYIKFQSVQDKTAILDKVKIGDEVKVHFNLKGTRWMKDGRENYITNLDAWRIEPVLAAAAANPANTGFDPNEMQVSNDITGDDLPF